MLNVERWTLWFSGTSTPLQDLWQDASPTNGARPVSIPQKWRAPMRESCVRTASVSVKSRLDRLLMRVLYAASKAPTGTYSD